MARGVLALGVLLHGAVAVAQPISAAQDPEREKQFRADVAAVSAEAADAYDRGNVARDANRPDDAIAAYRKAVELAPKVDHLHRRLCWALLRALKLDDATAECEVALSLGPESPYNKSALAYVLGARNEPAAVNRAASLAREAADALPNDVQITEVWCGATLASGNVLGLANCAERLQTLAPDGMSASFFGAMVAANSHDYDEAQRLLRKAKDAGLDASTYEMLRVSVEELEKRDSESWLPISSDTALEIGLATFAIWFLVLLLLMTVGGGLSRATLRTVDHAATEASGSPRERRLRKAYKLVLLLAGLFFYLSMPVMLLTIVATGVGIVLVFDEMGGIPIIVLWLLGVMVVATIAAILSSLFVRREELSLGKPVDFAAYPKLRALLDEVAAVVGTRPVDVAYLVPGAEIAVTERGSLWRSLRGKHTERALLMGVALFDGMTQLQLRTILAHEYGHFQNADTAGGGFALAVRRSLFSLIERMAKSGVAHLLNPVWWFARVYHRVYLGISQGASRLQEALADRWAIRANGSAAFIAAHRHMVARHVEFTADLDAILEEAIANQWPLSNLYDVEPDGKKSESELAAAIEKELQREPTLYDSHPSSRQRIEWAERLGVIREPGPQDDAPAWELFDDPEAIERAMTALVRDDIHARMGVIISDREYDADDEDDAAASS